MTGRHGAVRRRARLFRTGVMLVVSLGAGTVWAQEPGAPVADPVVPAAPVVGPGKPLHATRTPRPPTLDGRLDDAVWTAAVPDEHFLQFFPNHGKPVSERTQIRVLYDDTAIYVGVWLYDAEPEKIVARTTRRDREIESDHISIFFDSAHDHNTAYGFTLNAAGVLSDGLHHTDDDFNADWDAVWNGKTSRDADGWQAEFAIPLSALRFSSAPVQTWGFQAIRYISRKKEVSLWTLVPLEGRGVVSRAGHLEGLIGIRPRRTLEWRPFVVGRLTAQTPEGGLVLNTDSDLDGGLDAGFDVKFGITSDLTLDSTVNPDFSQVEVDEAVVNLTRFETFFPEKRPFFLEASPLFATPTQLFYSRRVGANLVETAPGDTLVDRSGEEVTVTAAPERRRIWNATKLTGKLSRKLSIGLFHALMDSEDVTVVSASGASRSQRLTPPHSYSVARARYGADGATYVGAMATAAFRLGGDVYRAEANHDDTVQSIDGEGPRLPGR